MTDGTSPVDLEMLQKLNRDIRHIIEDEQTPKAIKEKLSITRRPLCEMLAKEATASTTFPLSCFRITLTMRKHPSGFRTATVKRDGVVVKFSGTVLYENKIAIALWDKTEEEIKDLTPKVKRELLDAGVDVIPFPLIPFLGKMIGE